MGWIQRKSTALAALVGLAWGLSPAHGQEGAGAMSVSEVLAHAREKSPTMVLAEGDLDTADHSVGKAVGLHLPHISVSDRQTYRYNNPERYSYSYSTEVGGTCAENPAAQGCLPVVVIDGVITAPENNLSNAISFSGLQPVIAPRQIIAIRQAQGSRELVKIKVEGTEEQLVLDMLSDYIDLQGLLSEEVIFQQTLDLNLGMAADIDAQLQTGQATSLDLNRARLDVQESTQRLAQVEEDRGLIGAQLAFSAGLPPGQEFRVCPLGSAPAPEPLDLRDATQLKLAAQQVEMDRLALSAARSSLLPTLNVVAGATFTGNGETFDAIVETFIFDSWFVGGSLSIGLFEGMGRYHDNQSAKTGLSQSELKLRQERGEAALRDTELKMKLEGLEQDLALLDEGIKLAELNTEAVRSRYLAALSSFEMWTAARKDLEFKRLRRVELTKQQWQLTAYRWILGGHMEALVDAVTTLEEAQTSCRHIQAMDLNLEAHP